MDISQETDEQKLKAMAYDEMRQLSLHQQNLQMIESQLTALRARSVSSGMGSAAAPRSVDTEVPNPTTE